MFYLQVEPVFLPACLNKAIQITLVSSISATSIIYIYLPLAHNYFIKTTLYFDLDDQISLTSRNSSHCVSYVVYSNLTSYYDNG